MKHTIRAGLLLLAAAPVSAQTPTLADWDLVCFCSSRVSTPHFIIRMDNNGAILYATRAGASRDELARAGISATDSQLRLLEDWGLLSSIDGVLRTTFPVLGPLEIGGLRRELRTLARANLPAIRPFVDSIVATLTARGDARAGYAVVFSYVLDGLVWEALAPGGEPVPTDITIARPFWNGAFWALDPKRERAPGTNSHQADDSTTVMITWTDATLPLLGPVQRRANVEALLRAIRERDAGLVPPELAPYGLVGTDGRLAVAVIDERGGDPVAGLGRRMAGVVGGQMTDWVARPGNTDRIGAAGRGLALLVAYHEYMWELLDALLDDGAVSEPAALHLADPTSTSVRPLITMVIR